MTRRGHHRGRFRAKFLEQMQVGDVDGFIETFAQREEHRNNHPHHGHHHGGHHCHGHGHHKPKLDHGGLSQLIQEHGTPGFKADSRIRSFLEFGNFQPRPDGAPPAPDDGSANFEKFSDQYECEDNDCTGLVQYTDDD